MIGVAAIGVLPNELDGDWAFYVIGHVEQLAANNADIVLFEAVFGFGGGRCRLGCPLDGHWLLGLSLQLLLLGWRG